MGNRASALLDRIVTLGEPSKAQECPLKALARSVTSAAGRAEAIKAVRETQPDLVVIREDVPLAEGLTFLDALRSTAPDTPVVVLASRPDAEATALYLRSGAHDYVPAPLDDAAKERLAAAARGRCAAGDPDRFFCPECAPGVPIVGRSEGIRQALKVIRLVGRSACNPVLVVGETGTGKELAARAIHTLRGGKPDTFIAVNCATLTANLLESELFGHVKGAFTGADHEKTGLFELAAGGSLLLDEVSEMPQNLQAKLLRVLQEKQFRKVGGTKDIACDATIICSSNRDLAADSKEGRFRGDLYYRLAVFPILIPPLRAAERRDDVPLLAEYFVETCALSAGRKIRGLTPEAHERLTAHSWPGNVRELRNVIERAILLEQADQVRPDSLMMDDPAPAAAGKVAIAVPDDDFSLETAERLFITRALQETGWQRTRAAALLGITRATLHAKLKRYKITIPDGAASGDAPARPAAIPSRLQEACV